jgi:hypothetical protein
VENGRATCITWMDEHYNGEGELSKRTAMAKSKLENLQYKNKCNMSFEHCTKIMTSVFIHYTKTRISDSLIARKLRNP